MRSKIVIGEVKLIIKELVTLVCRIIIPLEKIIYFIKNKSSKISKIVRLCVKVYNKDLIFGIVIPSCAMRMATPRLFHSTFFYFE
jgi:hypothetical protein